MDVRKAVFAGSWYPRQADACEADIQRYLAGQGRQPDLQLKSRLGGIVPHAGWYYSGEIACQVINALKEDPPPHVVVLFGMHLHAGSASYIMAQGAWETPFGLLPVAEDLAAHLLKRFDFQVESVRNFVQYNTIELQLPFVRYLIKPERILALGVPPVAQSLDMGREVVDWATQNGKRLKIIGSTDLTHYGAGYGFSPRGSGKQAVAWVRNENDRRVIDAMLAMTPERVIEEGLQHQNACCSGAAATAIAAAKHMGASQARTLAYATSYDKSPEESFVGYVGIVFGK